MGARTVDVWNDRWVPNQNGGLIKPIDTSNRFTPLLVADLVNENRCWNIGHLEPFLEPKDIRAIKAIPIGRPAVDDILVWPHTKNGTYSIKSGYHRLVDSSKLKKASKPSSSHRVDRSIWRLIWNPRNIPKISNFLWRAVSDALPTAQNVYKHRITNTPLCPICGEFPETPEHSLLLCPWTANVWFGSPLSYIPEKQSITSLEAWLLGIQKKGLSLTDGADEFVQLVCVHLWEIWKHRCEIVLRQVTPNPSFVIENSRRCFSEWVEASKLEGNAPSVSSPPGRNLA
ncbi:uncharacterized protein LOC133739497 [Rosa rugosa]|uniref:uncharacterized protein LOC133739497 n=1 Tax=Rosa rugosa TaxID=74645 RepID=UPI002B40B4AE|nr:uncharacterized protein LOC133739497 [Rosa rugosa]